MKFERSSAIIVVAVILGTMAVVVPVVGGQGLTPSQCTNQMKNLEVNCRGMAIAGSQKKPTAACCGLVRAARLECVCPRMTPKLVAALGGTIRAVRFIRGCGRLLPRNFKCGALTTPP